MAQLLVIDDEPSILHAFRRVFDDPQLELLTAETAAAGEHIVREDLPDVVVLDLNLPDRSGLQCFERIKEIDPRIPVIFITGHGTVESAIEATKHGAFDYLFKPLELSELKAIVAKALRLSEMMKTTPVVNPDNNSGVAGKQAMVGRCEAMQEIYKAIGRVAAKDITVLIQGESGTGKELVAKALYKHSLRSKGPFRALNCAAIPESLLESELFGHEKGAFTGADRRRIGHFEQANHGTLFLDEVGDMSAMTQSKLLRVLQERTLERVGGSETISVDVRVIAATNLDLEKLVGEGKFRSDLFFRLRDFTINLPPLRERGDDIQMLVEHFLCKHSAALGKNVTQVAESTMDVLRAAPWPGNVRELESAIKQSLLNTPGAVLLPECLPPSLGGSEKHADGHSFQLQKLIEDHLREDGATDLYAKVISNAERELFTTVLKHTSGNQVHASAILGISRVTLRNKLRTFGINAADFDVAGR
ncbi:sigma-54-dependent transcriptional regulator [Fuerstiella marisgermanici]|uniref:DNA-binding transcriptional regulator NtrC n=1 Tax=Fuerstiella marisgermanici TaxID=1891926 RepID=A0A1P8WI56_9PLAN|nr:sigma-54 dependent transcriptional regulator [Fuerstiella marisgermanici]APZ93717.1 Nitrogen assimilation regulatory protein [Fuerstiella marisgermanici]